MDPQQEAKYKDVILRFLKDHPSKQSVFYFIIHLEDLNGISEAAVIHLINEIADDGYFKRGGSKDGNIAYYDSSADYFLEQGGYEAKYIAEQSLDASEEMKYRKIDRQEGFIREINYICGPVFVFLFM